MINQPSVRVAVAQFEDIVAHGLRALITEDDSLDLVADGVPHDELKSALSTLRSRRGDPQLRLADERVGAA